MGRLENYVQVNERIASATPPVLAPLKTLATDAPVMLTDSMGYIKAYITLEDDRHAEGTATFDLSLTGKSAQATNPIEDCETSAVGRALAFLGYHSDKSIASREEVQEAQRRQPQPRRTLKPKPEKSMSERLEEWGAKNDVDKKTLLFKAGSLFGVTTLDELTVEQGKQLVESFTLNGEAHA